MIGAVDIGGTKISAGIINHDGQVVVYRERPSGNALKFTQGITMIVSMLKECAREISDELEGIGVGCTGPVDPFTGEILKTEFLPEWEGGNLVTNLQEAMGVDVVLENDADAAALGEWAWGAGKGSSRFLYTTISTGIGVGMVFDGQLYRGTDGAHPEIGHHVIDPAGPECSCGARGCWESLAGGPALARNAHKATALEACQAAEAGDPVAISAVEREAFYLGLGFANLVNIFVPDVIAVGGGVMQSRSLFWETINKIIQNNGGMVPYEKTKLVPAQLGVQAGLIGAARAWIQNHQPSGI